MKKFTLSLSLVMGALIGMAQPCLPTYNNACTSGDFIDGVVFNTISNVGTGCAAPSANNYTDYSASFSTILSQGLSYNITTSSGPSWGQYFVAWIDFDQNGTFDATEFFDIGYAAAGTSVSNTINIPTGVIGGTSRMRVMCRFGTGPITATEACSSQTWGETEDYEVIVSLPSDYEASTISIDAPFTGCSLGLDTVKATFTNAGQNAIDTLVVCYSSNSGPWVCDTLTGLGLASGDTLSHNFATLLDLSIPDDYLIDVAVTLAGDTINQNDTIFGYLVQSIPTIATIPYFEDFETGSGGWTSTGASDNWELGVANEGNGGCNGTDSSVWATGLTTLYNSNTLSYLESPCIDFSTLTSDPLMTFDFSFQVENTFDQAWVEISTDGGQMWTKLGTVGSGLNWYNTAVNQAWEGASNGWLKAGHVLTGAAGSSDYRVRFVISSDGSVQQEGLAVDNININVTEPLVDVLPVGLLSPQSSCGLTTTEIISASFENIGLDTVIGFDICYMINGGTPICETISDSIIPGTPFIHTFSALADLSTSGTYMIDIIYSSIDLDACNDTVSFLIENKPNITTYPYLEKFENGSGGWTAENAVNGTWELATPANTSIIGAASGSNAWITNATGDYNVNDNSSVESPCFDFTTLDSGSWVVMKVWWESEFSWDGANLQFSLDTGSTWNNIGAFGNQNNWFNDNTINGAPGGSQEGWTGRNSSNNGSNGWVIAKHPLEDSLVGETHVTFRVNFGSDGSVTDDGFAFDDFAIGTPPTIDIGPDFVGCANYDIEPGLPGTFDWYAQDTSATPVTSYVSTGPIGTFTNTFFVDTTYNAIVVYTDSLGLCASDTALLTLNPAPYNVLNDTTICYFDSVMYEVDTSSRYTYLWNTGSMVDSALYTYTVGGPVSVTVTDTVSGCASTAGATIFQTEPVNIADSAFCAGDSIEISAGMIYSSFNWSTGDTLNNSVLVSMGGVYSVTVMDSIGCVSSDSTMITMNALPTPLIIGGEDSICSFGNLNLSTNTVFINYTWSTGGIGQTETVIGGLLNLGTNVITLTVEDGNGCINSDSITVFVDHCVGIDENVLAFNIYPNPSNGIFKYNFEGDFEGAQLILMDLSGKTVETMNVTSNTGAIDISSMARGTYLLQVSISGQVETIRLIKQ